MRLTERERAVLLEALHSAPTSNMTQPEERTALALKLANDAFVGDELASVNAAKLDATMQMLEVMRSLNRKMGEDVGTFVAFLERAWPVIGQDVAPIDAEIEAARQRLLEVKRVDERLGSMFRELGRL